MGSDKTRALMAFAKIAIAVVVGYGIFYMWTTARTLDNDDAILPGFGVYLPYAAALICIVMVFLLLSKLNKGSGD